MNMPNNKETSQKEFGLIQSKGFTLIELVVATGIFLIVVTVSTGIFVLNNRTQQRTDKIQKLQTDLGFVMEKIADDIRFGYIDYSQMPQSVPTDYLALRDSSGKSIRYILRPQGLCASVESTPCVFTGRDLNGDNAIDDNEYAYLTSKNVRVKSLRFFLSPITDPFTPIKGLYSANQQPQVTIIVSADNVGGDPVSSITLQSTVVSRVYKR